ncbi:MAG: type IV secretion system protein, partial [Chloroflexi bacterium]|nr:type IV secretion system protein [Chloroflexota bacterium]
APVHHRQRTRNRPHRAPAGGQPGARAMQLTRRRPVPQRWLTGRRSAPLLGVLIGVLGAVLASQPALAQAQVAALQPAVQGTGLGDLLADPGKWATTMFNEALIGIGQKTASDVVGFMGWLLGNGNLISQTPPGLSYSSDAVARLWGTVRAVANAGLAVVTVWGGVNLMVHPHIRAPYHGALELVPRVLLSGILVNFSLDWGRFVIDLNNALCRELGATSIPAWDNVLQPGAGPVLMNVIAMAIYLLMGLLLLGQMLMRLALLDVLLVIAPLALLCWVLPQTYSWARLWFSTFFGTVFVQSIQVLVLQLGAALIQRLPSLLSSVGSEPVDNGRVWLVTLLLGVAVLQLARKVPRLMPGYPAGGGGAAGLGSVRQVASVLMLAGGQKAGGQRRK